MGGDHRRCLWLRLPSTTFRSLWGWDRNEPQSTLSDHQPARRPPHPSDATGCPRLFADSGRSFDLSLTFDLLILTPSA